MMVGISYWQKIRHSFSDIPSLRINKQTLFSRDIKAAVGAVRAMWTIASILVACTEYPGLLIVAMNRQTTTA